MAFAIREHGSRQKLIEYVKALKETGADGKELKDQSQINAAKDGAISELGALAEDFNGALVIIEGHNNGVSRSFTVQVIGQKLKI